MMLPSLLLSLALASVFLVLVRYRAPRWIHLVLGVLPPALLLLCFPSLRVYGYHGFLQAGIVYQILHGNIPPTSPLLAGQPGTYPWGGAMILAAISKLFGISPFWAAAIVSIASLVVLLLATYRIGLLVTGDREASLFGTAIPLYAFTFTQAVPDNPIRSFLERIVPIPFVEPRGAPILEKFNGCTAFPLGLALYAVALLYLLKLAREGAPRLPAIAAFAASFLALGYVYPYLFPSTALLTAVAVVLAWRAAGTGKRLALILSGTLVLVAACVLPYYLHLKTGRTNHALELIPLPGFLRALAVIVVTFLPISLLVAWARRPVRETLRAQGRAATLLLVSAGMNTLLFAFLLAPLWSQHNFLLLAVFALGIVGGIAFQALYERAWPAALAVLALFLVPFCLDCLHKVNDWDDAPRVFREAGVTLEHTDPAERDLYRWVRTQTDPRAVFVDRELGLPVFGQRALFVALPKHKEMKALITDGGDGYALDPRIFMKIVDGYPEALVDQRLEIAERILAGATPAPSDLAAIAAAGPRAYLVLRPGSTDTARPQDATLFVVFTNPAATVIELPR
jgi:hypothetical protein